MGNIVSTDALGRLVGAAGACHGAVFLSYTFDARFFEEEVLAAVLQLQEDPTEATRRFLDEGRRELVETPVLVIADPGSLRGGQRLPYDLLRADTARLFHPKLALLLFTGPCARMVMESQEGLRATRRLWRQHTSFSAVLPLDYAREDAGLCFRRVVAFMEASGAHGEASRPPPRQASATGKASGPEDDADTAAPSLLRTFARARCRSSMRFSRGCLPMRRSNVLACSLLFSQEDGATRTRRRDI